MQDLRQRPIRPTLNAEDKRVTVSSSVVTLAGASGLPSFAGETRWIVIDVQDNAIMVTFDLSDPSSSNGHAMAAGTSAVWSKDTARTAKMIRKDSSDAVVHASEFTD